MKKITLEVSLDPAAWEVIEGRVKRNFENIRQELDESGEEFTFDDAVKNELLYIIDQDIRTYDIYDEARHSAEVQAAIRKEIKKVNDRELNKQ